MSHKTDVPLAPCEHLHLNFILILNINVSINAVERNNVRRATQLLLKIIIIIIIKYLWTLMTPEYSHTKPVGLARIVSVYFRHNNFSMRKRLSLICVLVVFNYIFLSRYKILIVVFCFWKIRTLGKSSSNPTEWINTILSSATAAAAGVAAAAWTYVPICC